MYRFERGKSIKSSLGLGEESKLDGLARTSIEHYKFNMCNRAKQDVVEKTLTQIMGCDVLVSVNRNVNDDNRGWQVRFLCPKLNYDKEFPIIPKVTSDHRMMEFGIQIKYPASMITIVPPTA